MRYLLLLLCACGNGTGAANPGGVDAATDGHHGIGDGHGAMTDASHGSSADGHSAGFTSTLTSTCATLQGRALVNYNDNLGIAFTDDDSPYAFRGSIQFELPDGFTGAAPNPEDWDGSSPRHVIAMTDADYDLHGNHCWNGEAPPPGTLVVQAFDTGSVVVRATFDAFPMHGCTDDSVCTVSGTIQTTAAGVFD